MTRLAIVGVPASDAVVEKLQAIIRPEFLTEVYVADEDDDILAGQGRTYDLRAAPALMRLELQYALQCRHDARRSKFAATDVNLLVEDIAGFTDEDSFTTVTLPEIRCRSRYVWGYVADVAREAYDERAVFDCDTWDLRRLGIDGRKGEVRFLHFGRITQPWLRELAKQHLRYQLARGLGSGRLHAHCQSIAEFAWWLHEQAPILQSSEEVGRDVLEQFVIHVRAKRPPATAQHKLLILKAFVENAEQLGWGRFGGRLYDTDIPRPPALSPKAIDEFVMAQLESPEVLRRIACPYRRALIELIMLTGMRASEARGLSFDPISTDSSGAPVLTYQITKTGLGLHTVPVSQRVVEIIEGQQDRGRERYGKEVPCLFPRPRGNPDGLLPWSPGPLRNSLKKWLGEANVQDRKGRPVKVTLHQFRHTIGTRMVNQGLDMTIIKRMLGHKSIAMTEHYARLNDNRLREEFERFSASRVNIYGQLVQPSNSDAEWTKERLARALVTTQNGYCGRPIQLECPHPNACLTCPDFLTDTSHLAAHRRQLAETGRLISLAELQHNTRMVEMNRQVAANLEKIIASLEPLADARDDSDAA
mgnify:CR=1 FL=1